MSDENKPTYDHDTPPNMEHRGSLTRQLTLQLSPDQYERLFFQPNSAKGDLAKRLGNPTLLGLLGFLVPFSSTMFCLLNFQGASALSLNSNAGSFYFFGGIAMVMAGIAEFILGNTFPFTVFTIYGVHWVNQGYTGDPVHSFANAYGATAAGNAEYQTGQAMYSIVMLLVTFIFLIGSLRTNVPFVVVFTTLVFLFAFFAAGQISLAKGTAAATEHALYYFKIAGGFGFVTMMMGWYLAIITVCASVGLPCPLPIFDLSSKFLTGSDTAKMQEHAGAITEEIPRA